MNFFGRLSKYFWALKKEVISLKWLGFLNCKLAYIFNKLKLRVCTFLLFYTKSMAVVYKSKNQSLSVIVQIRLDVTIYHSFPKTCFRICGMTKEGLYRMWHTVCSLWPRKSILNFKFFLVAEPVLNLLGYIHIPVALHKFALFLL